MIWLLAILVRLDAFRVDQSWCRHLLSGIKMSSLHIFAQALTNVRGGIYTSHFLLALSHLAKLFHSLIFKTLKN